MRDTQHLQFCCDRESLVEVRVTQEFDTRTSPVAGFWPVSKGESSSSGGGVVFMRPIVSSSFARSESAPPSIPTLSFSLPSFLSPPPPPQLIISRCLPVPMPRISLPLPNRRDGHSRHDVGRPVGCFFHPLSLSSRPLTTISVSRS